MASCVIIGLLAVPHAAAQNPAINGQWVGPYHLSLYQAWNGQAGFEDIGIETVNDPILDPNNPVTIWHAEVGAACLIPPSSTDPANPGPYAGQVLVWNLEVCKYLPTPPNQYDYAYKKHRVWIIDPSQATPTVTTIDLNYNVVTDSFFCSGFSWDGQGKLITAGGDNYQDPPKSLYQIDPGSITVTGGGITKLPVALHEQRFYPSKITLGDGMSAVLGGFTAGGGHIFQDIEFYDPQNPNPILPPTTTPSNMLQAQTTGNSWEQFPHMFSTLAGRIFVAFDTRISNYHVAATWDYQNFGTSSSGLLPLTGTLTQLSTNATERNWGNAVIMEERNSSGNLNERIFAICGSPYGGYSTPQLPCLASIDEWVYGPGLSPGSWSNKGSGTYGRMFCNSVSLPDQTVFIVGGTSTDSGLPTTPTNYATPVQTPEIFKPDRAFVSTTSTWTQAAQHTIHRMDHSTALLLPDGRVFTIGGLDSFYPSMCAVINDPLTQRPGDTAEIYSPPYLLRGPRPGIGAMSNPSGASSIDWPYGSTASVDVRTTENPNPSNPPKARMVLMRTGSVTHQVDFDQRYVELNWSVTSSTGGTYTLSVGAPAASEKGAVPPGWYMLFYVSPSGIVSASKFVKIH